MRKLAPLVLLANFAALTAYSIASHAMWRDELQAWMIARESHSLGDLIGNLAYEGHPAAWHLLLWLVQRVVDHPAAMQVLQFAITLASMSLILLASPFRWVHKALLSLSYFFAFEYSVLARSYALGMLCAMLYAALSAGEPRRWPLWRAWVLAALANTSVYGLFLALSLFWHYLADARHLAWRRLTPQARPFLFGVGIFILACLISAWIMHSGVNAIQYQPWFTQPRSLLAFRKTVRGTIGAFFPVPVPTPEFWGTLAILQLPRIVSGMVLACTAGLLLFVILGMEGLAVYFLFPVASTLLFSFAIFPGTLRHFGILFVSLIAIAWLAPRRLRGWNTAFALLLMPQTVAGVMALRLHSLEPFSAARDAAAWLEARGPQFIAADIDLCTSSVAGYLKRPLLYLSSGQEQQFIRWDSNRPLVTPQILTRKVGELAARGQPFTLLLSYPWPEGSDREWIQPLAHARELARFTSSVVPDERFYVYEVTLSR